MKTRSQDYSKAFTVSKAEAAKALLELKRACVKPSAQKPAAATTAASTRPRRSTANYAN